MTFRKVETCDELLQQQDVKIIQSQIIDYVIYMREEQRKTAPTINTNLATIHKFYDTNDIELKWKRIKMYIGRGNNNNKSSKRDRPYSSFEISKMLEKADQRGRVAILLMSSTGMRVGALPSLRIRNLERMDKYNLYKITVYENEPEEYMTFCTPECAAAIDSYLEYRERNGERPLSEDSPLIREEFDINDEIRAVKPKMLGMEAFRRMIKRIGHDSGVMEKRAAIEPARKRGQKRPVKETHGFRKFYQTTSVSNGMSILYSEILMGHRSGGLALESYVRPSETDLLEGNDKMIGYAGVIDALTLDESQRLKREVQTLKIDKSKMEQVLERINLLEDKILNQ
jgi:integrase